MSSASMQNLKNMMKMNPSKLNFAEDMDYPMARKMHDMQSGSIPYDERVHIESEVIDGVETERLTPDEIKSDTILLQIHGGGFCFGSIVSCRSYAASLAAECGVVTYTLNYRLAPEFPFPAGVEDCYKVYKALLKRYPNSRIALLGESAGATFCLVVTLMAKDRKIKLPGCVCAYAPCVDLARDLPSRTQNKDTDMLIPGNIVPDMRRVYVVGVEPTNPYVSPIYGNYNGFPPLKLVADSGEVLADDTRILAEKAKKCGVELEYEMFDDTFHSFPAMGRMTEEGSRIMDETVKFIERCSKRV